MATFSGQLGLNDFSQEVSRVQRRLGLLGVGLFDEETHLAVRRFQGEHGLLTTGTVDEPTWLALEATVRRGLVPEWFDGPDAVVEARRRLGLRCGQTLGEGLRRYQTAMGLPVTGLLDEATATALGG